MTKQSISSSQAGGTPQYRDTQYTYNKRDLLTKVTSIDGGQEYYTEYTYDGVGNQTSTATGNGDNITSYDYNSLNQLIKLTDPMGESETYSYDLNNNLISKVDKNKNRIVNTYNALNQPLKCTVTQPDGRVQSQEISYASNGAKIREENENLSSSLRYDNQARVISQVDSNGITQNYTYDLAGNRITYRLKQNGESKIDLAHSYDKQNHLTSVSENGIERATYSYDANGNCTENQYDNGILINYTYNNANLITQMSNKKENTTLSSYAYTYYLDGNQRTKTDHLNQLTTYEYDGLGRLEKETDQNNETEYTYDQSSNRIQKKITGTTPSEINYEYDANDRLIWEETQKANNILATTEYYYDANGNQISKLFNELTDQAGAEASISLETQPDTPGFEYWEYDGFNRLTAYQTPTTTAEYTYNAPGLRITKKVNGQVTKHIWDGSNMVMELDDSDQVIDKYIRGYGLIKSDLNGYYLHNAHGDVIQLADQQGVVTRSYLYDAFGVEQESQPNDTNPFRYCGEYLDNESGNVYLRARYYDPATGRFISEDSYKGNLWNPLSLNLYTYCENEPLGHIDPSGRSMEGDENLGLTPEDQAAIDQYGENFNNATTVAEQQYWHDLANGIRLNYTSSVNRINFSSGSNEVVSNSFSGSGADYRFSTRYPGNPDYDILNLQTISKFGTTAIGLSGDLSAGPTLAITVQVVWDENGNKGIIVTVVPFTGGGTPNAGVVGAYSVTDAKTIHDLLGKTINSGGSINAMIVPASVGEEVNIGNNYTGTTTSLGPKLQLLPAEVHTNTSYTYILYSW